MNLSSRLMENSRLFPHREAVVYRDSTLTYAQLDSLVNQAANGLKALGIKPGERVILALNNSTEFIAAFYAVIRMRGIVVPISPHYTIYELSVILQDARPAAAIVEAPIGELYQRLHAEAGLPRIIVGVVRDRATVPAMPGNSSSQSSGPLIIAWEDIIRNQSPKWDKNEIDPHEVIELLYTTGTTGAPKAAMLSNYNLYSNAVIFGQALAVEPDDRFLLVAPAYHAAAQTCIMNTALMFGSTLYVREGWAGPQDVLQAIEKYRITVFFGPPTMYKLIYEFPEAERYNLGSLRIAFTGAAPLPVDLYYAFKERFGIELLEGYGLTETSPVVTINSPQFPRKPGSVGKPLPGVEVKIFDYEDHEIPRGQIGEIVVRGPNVMKGYYNMPEETSWVMRNGWFHTGDLGYMDEEDYVYIVDRKKDVIIRGGLNINPREIEEVLYSHPQVFDVVVVGVPDPIMGEEIVALVLPREGTTPDENELRSYCAEKLAAFKVPRYIRFVTNLPKTTAGKLLKKEIRAYLEQQFFNDQLSPENTP